MLEYIILEANDIHVPLICWILTGLPMIALIIGAILTWIERR